MITVWKGTVTKVASDLLGRKANYILPVETMCFELQKIADMYEEAGGEVSSIAGHTILSAWCVRERGTQFWKFVFARRQIAGRDPLV